MAYLDHIGKVYDEQEHINDLALYYYKKGVQDGYNKAIQECLEIVRYWLNEYDGIYSVESEIEEKLKESDTNEL